MTHLKIEKTEFSHSYFVKGYRMDTNFKTTAKARDYGSKKNITRPPAKHLR
jgi:hypothetical protein